MMDEKQAAITVYQALEVKMRINLCGHSPILF